MDGRFASVSPGGPPMGTVAIRAFWAMESGPCSRQTYSLLVRTNLPNSGLVCDTRISVLSVLSSPAKLKLLTSGVAEKCSGHQNYLASATPNGPVYKSPES